MAAALEESRELELIDLPLQSGFILRHGLAVPQLKSPVDGEIDAQGGGQGTAIFATAPGPAAIS